MNNNKKYYIINKININIKNNMIKIKGIKKKIPENTENTENTENIEIILLIRSYNRPEYLKKTLESLLNSNINKCSKRYIYDDYSTDIKTLNILNDTKYINKPSKEFIVIKNKINKGCKISYCDALNLIKKENINKKYFICTLDNDVIVKSNFLEELHINYMKALSIFKNNKILFTGFNPTNAHCNKLSDHNTFYRKKSFGGVNYFFHVDLIDYIINWWMINYDHGVNENMMKNNFPLCCLKKSVINHYGQYGLNSFGHYDFDKNF